MAAEKHALQSVLGILPSVLVEILEVDKRQLSWGSSWRPYSKPSLADIEFSALETPSWSSWVSVPQLKNLPQPLPPQIPQAPLRRWVWPPTWDTHAFSQCQPQCPIRIAVPWQLGCVAPKACTLVAQFFQFCSVVAGGKGDKRMLWRKKLWNRGTSPFPSPKERERKKDIIRKETNRKLTPHW